MARGSIQLTHDHPTNRGSISTLIVGEKDNLVGSHKVIIDGKTYTVSKEWLARKVLAQMLELEFICADLDKDETTIFTVPSLDDPYWTSLANRAISWLAREDYDFQEAMETLGLDLDNMKSPLWLSTVALFPGCEFQGEYILDQVEKFSLASVRAIYR